MLIISSGASPHYVHVFIVPPSQQGREANTAHRFLNIFSSCSPKISFFFKFSYFLVPGKKNDNGYYMLYILRGMILNLSANLKLRCLFECMEPSDQSMFSPIQFCNDYRMIRTIYLK